MVVGVNVWYFGVECGANGHFLVSSGISAGNADKKCVKSFLILDSKIETQFKS